MNKLGHGSLLEEVFSGDRAIDVNIPAKKLDRFARETDDTLYAIVASLLWAAENNNLPATWLPALVCGPVDEQPLAWSVLRPIRIDGPGPTIGALNATFTGPLVQPHWLWASAPLTFCDSMWSEKRFSHGPSGNDDGNEDSLHKPGAQEEADQNHDDGLLARGTQPGRFRRSVFYFGAGFAR